MVRGQPDVARADRLRLPRGRPPYAPIRGLPRAWAALGFRDPLGGATGPRREGLM